MAIKDTKESETFVVFDPTLAAYHEVCLDDAKAQLKSLLEAQKLIELLELDKKAVAKIVEKLQ